MRTASRVFMLTCLACLSRAAVPADIPIDVDGHLYIYSVDTKRIIVAIDANNDQILDRIFLYSSSAKLRVAPNCWNCPGKVSYREGAFLLVTFGGRLSDHPPFEFVAGGYSPQQALEKDAILFDKSIGLRQFVPAAPIRVSDFATLEESGPTLRKTADCDMSPQTCVAVAGQYFPFPG